MDDKLGIFRSVTGKETGKVILCRKSLRPPGNVPYVVDNLWEWKRPEGFPNRRFSVFASPQPELALECGSGDGMVFQVELQGKFNLCQVSKYVDSKKHPDCKELRQLLFRKLLHPNWADETMEEKEEVGRIFLPCLTKDEMELLFRDVKELREIRDQLYDAITYWDDVAILSKETEISDDQGEIFFEPFDGYFLRKL